MFWRQGFDRAHDIRAVTLDGDPWFVTADVRRVLGMARGGNRSKMFSDGEEMILRELNGVTLKGHGLSLLAESGLYKMIMRSEMAKEKAEAEAPAPILFREGP